MSYAHASRTHLYIYKYLARAHIACTIIHLQTYISKSLTRTYSVHTVIYLQTSRTCTYRVHDYTLQTCIWKSLACTYRAHNSTSTNLIRVHNCTFVNIFPLRVSRTRLYIYQYPLRVHIVYVIKHLQISFTRTYRVRQRFHILYIIIQLTNICRVHKYTFGNLSRIRNCTFLNIFHVYVSFTHTFTCTYTYLVRNYT